MSIASNSRSAPPPATPSAPSPLPRGAIPRASVPPPSLPPRPRPPGTITPQFPHPGDPVYGFVLAAVEEATALLHRRLNELEERSIYLIRRIAEATAIHPAPFRPETPPPAAEPSSEEPPPQALAGVSAQAPLAHSRDRRTQRAAVALACALVVCLGSLLGLAPSCR
jgi:hypothetical protein